MRCIGIPHADGIPAASRVVVRFAGSMFNVLAEHVRADPAREQFAFVLALPIVTDDCALLLVQQVLLPEPGDLAVCTAACVEPRPDFQATAYLLAAQRGLVVLDVHTHVTDAPPRLSRVDRGVGTVNARYIARRLPPPTTLGLLVFNRTLSAFDGLLFDRGRAIFTPISELQAGGVGLTLHSTADADEKVDADECYARQRQVSGWNQAALERLRIGIAGVGGHGAQLLQMLVSIGAGSASWIAGVDPDVVELSNLPRLPFATQEDVGTPKVDVAAGFVRRKNPAATFHACPWSVADPAARARLRGADVLFGCGDNDGVRLVLNELALRYGIPLIDLGADIHIAGDAVEAGGQVRVVVPGTTACLVCSEAFDPAQATLDLLSGDDRSIYRRRGYLIGSEQESAPSVAVLNTLVVQHAVTALLALVRSGPFVQHDYLRLDWLTGCTLTARAVRRDDCPACGRAGFLLAGDPPAPAARSQEPVWRAVPRGAAPDQNPKPTRVFDRCRGGTWPGT